MLHGRHIEKVALKPGRQARQARTERKEIHGICQNDRAGKRWGQAGPRHRRKNRPHGLGSDSPVIGDNTALSSVTDPYMNKYKQIPSLLWEISPQAGRPRKRNTKRHNRRTGGGMSVVDRLTLVRSGLAHTEPSGRDLAKASGLIAHR